MKSGRLSHKQGQFPLQLTSVFGRKSVTGQVTVETTLAIIIVFILLFASFRLFFWFTQNLVLREQAYQRSQPGQVIDGQEVGIVHGSTGRLADGSVVVINYADEENQNKYKQIVMRPEIDFYDPINQGTGSLNILGE